MNFKLGDTSDATKMTTKNSLAAMLMSLQMTTAKM